MRTTRRTWLAGLALLLAGALLVLWRVTGPGPIAAVTFPNVVGVADHVRPSTVLVVNLNRAAPDQATAGATPRRPRLVPEGFGTGFIYDAAGYIITNAHVVEGANRLQVQLPPPDNRTFPATLVGRDDQADLAVVKIDGTDLPTVPLGRSGSLRIGEWVVAVGNALALPGGPSVTAGVVSALDRTAAEPAISSSAVDRSVTLYDLIQTDAAINHGNSGGPLVNLEGEVVGITSLISENGQNVGYAIAIDAALPIVRQLREDGTVVQAALGLSATTVPPSGGATTAAPGVGVAITMLERGGPAATAGLRVGDVLVRVSDVPLTGVGDLATAIRTLSQTGSSVPVVVTRDGDEQTVLVTLDARSTPPPSGHGGTPPPS